MAASARAIAAPVGTPAQAERPALLALAQGGRVFEFVPRALAHLAAHPADAHLRLTLAATYGRLGLRTAALEQLDRLEQLCGSPDPASAPLSAAPLRAAARNLPDDRVDPAALHATLAANLAALEARGQWTGGVPSAWLARLGNTQHFRLRDGGLVRRAAPPPTGPDHPAAEPAWPRFHDDLAHARAVSLARAGFVSSDGTGGPRPVYLEGADPPWLLIRLASELTPRSDGATPPIFLLQEDPLELCDGLALADLRPLLAHGRLRVIIGPDASSRLEAFLAEWGESAGRIVGGHTLTLPSVRTPMARPVREVIEAVSRRQVAAVASDREAAAAVYASRDRAWWAQRYARALGSGGTCAGGPPLRVLIPTTRYSTYIQHAAAALAAALERTGAQARVLIEPDPSSSLAATAITRAIAHWQPDLLIQINYPRSSAADLVPANLPWACWIQDAMPHLFTRAAGASQGPLDFLVGHLHEELFAQFAWPRGNALYSPVTASGATFHAGPVDAPRAERFACEIAVATNHSQRPEDFLAGWLSGPGDAVLKRAVEHLAPAVRALVDRCAAAPASTSLGDAVSAALAHAGLSPDAQLHSRILNQVARPYADRLIRHQTIHWAAAIAQRRNWRLHLYGRGWDAHPTLARFARGEAPHGEDLRAAYHAAAATLHASIHGNTHQRLAECALSGGLPLVRLKHDDLNALMLWTQAAMCARGQCVAGTLPPLRLIGGLLVDGPETLRWAALQQRLGLPLPTGYSMMADPVQWDRPWAFLGGNPIAESEAWLMGDLADTGFRDEAELEAALERAVTRPAWRASHAQGIARRARQAASIEALAPRLLNFIHERLRG